MKKIAVLSDIHGNILALEKVVNDIRRRNVDLVLNLGDHVSGPLWPKETLDFLRQQYEWIQILGNHDRKLIYKKISKDDLSDLYASQLLTDDDLNWLRSLPEKFELSEDILLVHSSPSSDVYLLETVEDGRARLATSLEIQKRLGVVRHPVVLCGHSHVPRVVETPKKQLIVNPGSVGLPAFGKQNVLSPVIENGSPFARYAVLEKNQDGWIVDLITIPYDYHVAAKQASRNGFDSWEFSLMYGYMKKNV
jgi:putative phosphoesterase